MPPSHKMSSEDKSKAIVMTLNVAQKKYVISEILKIASPELIQALLAAIFDDQQFPHILEKLGNLQATLNSFKDNRAVSMHLNNAIEAYIQTEGIVAFSQLLQQEFVENYWKDAFLSYLAFRLQIHIKPNPQVELFINMGKIYWHVLQGEVELFNRFDPEVIAENSENVHIVHMSWQDFRMFKDAGKRGGSVAITRERFVAVFRKNQQNSAGEIWDELKENGHLDDHDRLSPGWNVLSNLIVYLRTRGNISYYSIINNLYKIANDQTHAETVYDDMTIFRRNRNIKDIASTGRVKNGTPRIVTHCVKLWDVSTYNDLDAHRETVVEKRLYSKKLNYDHIPSADAFKTFREEEIKKKLDEVADLKDIIKQKESESRKLDAKVVTKRNEKIISDNRAELKATIKNRKVEIAELEEYIKQLRKENEDNWWVIAIPENLHRQGETYQSPSKDQAESKEHPFLRDVRTYLNKLKINWEEYCPNTDISELLTAIGAFRYMYRAQVKDVNTTYTSYGLGRLPYQFFDSKGDAKKIDKLFEEELSSFLDKRYGLKK